MRADGGLRKNPLPLSNDEESVGRAETGVNPIGREVAQRPRVNRTLCVRDPFRF